MHMATQYSGVFIYQIVSIWLDYLLLCFIFHLTLESVYVFQFE